MGLPNCSLVLVYSAVRARAAAAAPAWASDTAAVVLCTSHSMMAWPSSTDPSSASGPTRVPVRVITASGCPVLVT